MKPEEIDAQVRRRVHRPKRPAFDTEYVRKVSKNKKGLPVKQMGGGPPKKLTKGLRRQLAKMWRQNPDEVRSQLRSVMGIDAPISSTGIEKLLGIETKP